MCILKAPMYYSEYNKRTMFKFEEQNCIFLIMFTKIYIKILPIINTLNFFNILLYILRKIINYI